MQLNDIRSKTKRPSKKRVARGGKRGKTAGRGTKGQKARAGGTPRPQLRDIIKKIPKKRGHGKNRTKGLSAPKRIESVNVSELEKFFSNGDVVSPDTLLRKGLIRKISGNYPIVKILGNGDIKKKLVLIRVNVSSSAKEKIERAGGTIK